MRLLCAAAISLAMVAPLLLAGCDDASPAPHVAVDGDAARGRSALVRYDCDVCHEIPGIARATGTVGPPLDAMARQVYIAGVVPNEPEQLVRWLMDPPAIDPRTAMPDLGVSRADALDMAAYLYERSE